MGRKKTEHVHKANAKYDGLVESLYKREQLFNPNEFKRRYTKRLNGWAVKCLAKNDLTKIEAVRALNYIDAINELSELEEASIK